ncbi:hypothetical protein AKG07_04720 [Microbacterium sp. CGR1]|uniref:hypothetical protein n=1 Tax=Microbacterium sp. CGR1 TaxID=1696072 RepID=UPI00069D6298|nr:hypothetical protein [Microbacterium sp. CGR1]AKV85710.1 hypothetical protein AKG07_04720 [Microbacterium sp. CGR1]
MTGLAAVIARVDAIETQIVSLDPAGRAAAASAAATATAATAETSAASATTFAGVLEAAKAASTPEAPAAGQTPQTAAAAAGTGAGDEASAEVISALQTLFSANATGADSSTASMQKIIEMLG